MVRSRKKVTPDPLGPLTVVGRTAADGIIYSFAQDKMQSVRVMLIFRVGIEPMTLGGGGTLGTTL